MIGKHPFLSVLALLSLGSSIGASPLAAQQEIGENRRVGQAISLAEVWLEAEKSFERIPGISVAVVHDQEVIWSAGFGFADLDKKTPATPETLYRACSVIKPFTATAIMQLREGGSLNLDDPIRRHLSWFELDDANADKITVEGLLTHSSGLPRDFPDPYWTGPAYPFPAREELSRKISHLRLAHVPRTRMLYSNVGMTLAGEIVAAASGVEFDDYLRTRIFEPLGLSATSVDVPSADRDIRLASGYTVLQREGAREEVPHYRVQALAPAAGLVSNVLDLARFASWQFRTVAGGSERVLSQRALQDMHQIQWMNSEGWGRSGYGYQTWAENDRHFLGHAGACPGYESKLLLRPQEKIAVILMTNAQGPTVDAYAQRLYDIFSPAIRSATHQRDATELDRPEGDPARYTGVYRRPLGGESAVIEWGEGLAVVSLPAGNPLRAMEVYEPTGDGTFRLEGSGADEQTSIRFDETSSGRMRMWRNHQYSIREVQL